MNSRSTDRSKSPFHRRVFKEAALLAEKADPSDTHMVAYWALLALRARSKADIHDVQLKAIKEVYGEEYFDFEGRDLSNGDAALALCFVATRP
jgi:hypothetical protein